jgi:hypothetical protein
MMTITGIETSSSTRNEIGFGKQSKQQDMHVKDPKASNSALRIY